VNARRTAPSQADAGSQAAERPRIEIDDPASVEHWMATLAVTRSQLKESVARVGPFADEVEMDLKGARTSTLAEQVGNKVG